MGFPIYSKPDVHSGAIRGSRLRRNLQIILLVALSILAGTGALVYEFRTAPKDEDIPAHQALAHARRTGLRIVPNFLRGMTAAPVRIRIEIKPKAFSHLALKRREAFQSGSIVSGEDSWVPGWISTGAERVKVSLRLKGDVIDHIVGDRWSLRIKIQDGGSLFAMTRFSLQAPSRSGFLNEWLYHRLARYEGLFHLRYRFVHVTINQTPMGIYAMEESFSPSLIGYNGRRNGVLLKFNESGLWEPGREDDPERTFRTSAIEPFYPATVRADPGLKKQFEIARDTLERFRTGESSVGATFDLPRTARMFALADLMGGAHGYNWKNIRFYYDPESGRLEPVAYNVYGGAPLTPAKAWTTKASSRSPYHLPAFFDLFFGDPDFLREYHAVLARIGTEEYLRSFLAAIDAELRTALNIVYSDAPYYHFPLDAIRDNQKTILRYLLNPR